MAIQKRENSLIAGRPLCLQVIASSNSAYGGPITPLRSVRLFSGHQHCPEISAAATAAEISP
jgi:hypothetical protein